VAVDETHRLGVRRRLSLAVLLLLRRGTASTGRQLVRDQPL
jgi:hypothetical protein